MAPPPRRRKVKIPVRIRVRGTRVDTERLTEHVATLTGRQIGRAADILDEEGAHRTTLRPLDITFTGAAAQLSEDEKAELERAVGRGLVQGTRVAHQARRDRRARKRQPDQVRARVKDAKPGAKKKVKDAPAVRAINTWHQFDAAGNEEFQNALLVALSNRFKDGYVPVVYGVLFRLKGSDRVQLWIVSNLKWVSTHGLTNVTWSGGKPGSEPVQFEPGSGEFRLEQDPDGLTSWREGAYKNAQTQKGLAGSGTPGDPRGLGTVTRQPDIAQPARDLAAEARAAVDEYTKDWPTRIRVYYRLKGGGMNRIIPYTSPDVPILGSIDVVALIDQADAKAADEAAEALTDGAVVGRDLLPKGGEGGKGGGEGQGEGRGAGGTGSDVTAPPGQDVGKGGAGIVIAPEYKVGAPIFPVSPRDPDAKSVEITCQPYEDEPHLVELGRGGELMTPLIAEIARRLDMPPCPWPAHFCIMASRMVAARASDVHNRFRQDDTGFIEELTVGALDESGFVFRPLPSVGIQYLQRLAEVVPRIRVLMELVEKYTLPITTKRYFAWGTHWVERVLEEIFPACALIWYFANQFLMHQLLNTSLRAVRDRQARLTNYAEVFRVLCKTQLADQAELIMLRSALAEFESIAGSRGEKEAYQAVRTHYIILHSLQEDFESREALIVAGPGSLDADLVLRLKDSTDYVFGRGAKAGIVGTGQITRNDAGAWVIRASDGTLYTKDVLDKLVALRQQVIVSIDPLISQLVHRFVSVVRPLVENPDPQAIPEFLKKLFEDMAKKNDEVRGKNRSDMTYAFEHGQIHTVSDDPKAAPAMRIPTVRGGRWVLSGVHALAHAEVGVWFQEDSFYTSAIDRLLGHEHAWRSFAEDMVFIFGIALSVICPPVGAAFGLIAGIALGVEKYVHTKEQETIYGALINPDQVLDYAEIQVELFMAKLTIGLSFLAVIPEGVSAVKAVSGASKRAIQRGIGSGAKAIAKQLIAEELDRLGEMCVKNFIKGLAIELISETVEDKVVGILIGPIIEGQIAQLEKELKEEGLL